MTSMAHSTRWRKFGMALSPLAIISALISAAVVGVPWWAFAAIVPFTLLITWAGTESLTSPAALSAAWSRRVSDNRPSLRYLTPRELPVAPSPFIGRGSEIAKMIEYQRTASTIGPKVLVLSGPAGIGKTALALHFGRAVTALFPHGQLFAGETERGSWDENSASCIQAGFIEALQGPEEIIPDKPQDRGERYKKLTSDRRVLIVVDDVHDEEGIRSLLPSTPSCTVVATSRAHILLTADQLDIEVEPLDDDASLSLLAAMVGEEKVSRDINSARKIVGKASGYPLAVRLAGASLATRQYWGLGRAAMRLEQEESSTGRNGRFTSGPGGLLDMSYVMLTKDERAALCAVGLIGEPLFEPWMVAAILGTDVASAALLIESLMRERLIERFSEDSDEAPQFQVHQQVLAYARNRLFAETTAQERQNGIRLLTERRLQRQERSPFLELREEVFTWLDQGKLAVAFGATRDALAVAHAKGDKEATGLALAALAELYLEIGFIDDAQEMADNALNAPGKSIRPRALRCLAKAKRRLRQISDAYSLLEQAHEATCELDDPSERVRVLRELAAVQALGDEPKSGITTAAEALQLCDEREDRGKRLRAGVLWSMGSAQLYAGNLKEAMLTFRDAEQIAIDEKQHLWLAWIGQGRSRVAMEAADYVQSREFASRALEMFRDMRHRYGVAHCRLLLGQIYRAETKWNDAARVLDQALETFQGCGDRWMTASAMHTLALNYLDEAQREDAVDLLEDAYKLFAALSDEASSKTVRKELNSTSIFWARLANFARS